MTVNPPLDTFINLQLDKKDTVWYESHLTAFYGIKKAGMYGMNTMKILYKDIKTLQISKQYPVCNHFIAEAIRILFDNPLLIIEIQETDSENDHYFVKDCYNTFSLVQTLLDHNYVTLDEVQNPIALINFSDNKDQHPLLRFSLRRTSHLFAQLRPQFQRFLEHKFKKNDNSVDARIRFVTEALKIPEGY